MKILLSKAPYLLLTMLMFALSGCGTTQTTANGGNQAPGKVTALIELPKSAAKSVALSGSIATFRLKVTGATIPTAVQDFTGSTGGTIEVYPGSDLIVAAYAYTSTGALIYEGFSTGQAVNANATTTVQIQLYPPVVKAENAPCLGCHDNTRDITGQNLVANYKQSGHYFNNSATAYPLNGAIYTGCAGCHGTQHNDTDPANSGRCWTCHNNGAGIINANHNLYLNGATNTCGTCHQPHDPFGPFVGGSCVACHAFPQDKTLNGSYVNDNSGVRAITSEFTKNSHHVTGKTLTNADCAVCHMEGSAGGALNTNYHMKDNKIHLRNCNPTLAGNQSAANGAEYIWDPANPNHTAMDQFCMSCHNAAGATAAVNIVTGNTARNPFNDTISNGYDQMSRTYVVAVYEQFDTGNTSHHAVRGKKYQGRTRAQSEAIVGAGTFTQYSGAVVGKVLYRASAPTTPVRVQQYFGSYSSTGYSNAGYGPKSPGSRKTIYEAGLFTANFTTLDGTVLGDDSTLHCGDCHTVGQWAPNVTKAVNADGTIINAPAAIGAHGSANEYLLRNSVGTDALMVANSATVSSGNAATTLTSGTSITYGANGQANNLNLSGVATGTQVCYLCHKQVAYAGNIAYFNWADPLTGALSATRHAGLGGGDCTDAARDSTGKLGALLRVGIVASSPTGGRATILGNVCSNCHNSGNQIFGGIHGNASSYGDFKNVGYKTYSTNGKDAMTNVLAGATGVLGGTGTTENRNQQLSVVTRKPYRFMGGVSLKYSGGGSADKWEAKVLTTQHREGCYNISTRNSGLYQWSAADGSSATFSTYSGVPNYPGTTRVPPIASGSDDLGYTAASGTGAQNVNSGAAGSWGACGHHTGSAASGTSNMPKRTLQRPLKY